jgi:hypothetical protein
MRNKSHSIGEETGLNFLTGRPWPTSVLSKLFQMTHLPNCSASRTSSDFGIAAKLYNWIQQGIKILSSLLSLLMPSYSRFTSILNGSLCLIFRWEQCFDEFFVMPVFCDFLGRKFLRFRLSCRAIVQDRLAPNYCSPFSVKHDCGHSRGNCWQIPICFAVHLLPLFNIRDMSSLKPSSITLVRSRDSNQTASTFCRCPNMLIWRVAAPPKNCIKSMQSSPGSPCLKGLLMRPFESRCASCKIAECIYRTGVNRVQTTTHNFWFCFRQSHVVALCARRFLLSTPI